MYEICITCEKHLACPHEVIHRFTSDCKCYKPTIYTFIKGGRDAGRTYYLKELEKRLKDRKE